MTNKQAYVRILVLLPVFVAFILPAIGCDQLAAKKDVKVSATDAAATVRGGRSQGRAATIPPEVLRDLPVPENSELVSYSKRGDALIASFVSSLDTLETTKWMLGRLQELGYNSGDNASRILEGVEYLGDRSRFDKLYIKVNLQADNKCVIELRAYGD